MTFKHFHDGKTQRRELKKISRPSYFRPTCLWLWFVPWFHMVSVGTVCGCCQQCCRLELVKNWYICNRLVCVLCRKACVKVLSLRMYYTCTPSGCGALIHHEGSAFVSLHLCLRSTFHSSQERSWCRRRGPHRLLFSPYFCVLVSSPRLLKTYYLTCLSSPADIAAPTVGQFIMLLFNILQPSVLQELVGYNMKIWPHFAEVVGNKHLTRGWADRASNSNLLWAPCWFSVLPGSAGFSLHWSLHCILFPCLSLLSPIASRFIDIDLLLKLSVQIPEQGEQSLNQLKRTSPIRRAEPELSLRPRCWN